MKYFEGMKLFLRNLFFPLDEDIISNTNYEIYNLKKLFIFFICIHTIFGITNILSNEKTLLGIFEFICMGIFGLIVIYSKILILFILYSLICMVSCILHFKNIVFQELTISDIINIICISEVINSMCCSIITIEIFAIIIRYIDIVHSFELLNRQNYSVAYIDYPRINNLGNIGYLTPSPNTLEDNLTNDITKESFTHYKEEVNNNDLDCTDRNTVTYSSFKRYYVL